MTAWGCLPFGLVRHAGRGKAVSALDIIVLSAIASFQNTRDRHRACWPAVRTVAALIGTDVRQTQRHIDKLVCARLLSVEPGDTKTSGRYRLLDPSNLWGSAEEVPREVDGDVQDHPKKEQEPADVGLGVDTASDPAPTSTSL